jgi:hypothetical protein
MCIKYYLAYLRYLLSVVVAQKEQRARGPNRTDFYTPGHMICNNILARFAPQKIRKKNSASPRALEFLHPREDLLSPPREDCSGMKS